MATQYRGYNWDAVYDALISMAEGITNADSEAEFGQIEAGKPDNISLHPGDTLLIAIGKIEKITSAMGGKGKVANCKGYFLIYVDGNDEPAQRRASYLWDRLAAEITAKTLLLPNCKCKIDETNPGGFRQNDRNMGTSSTPDMCAGAVLIVDIQKGRELVTL